ncbi:SCO4225 family membrane protein [Streptomyces sp. NPDC014995]|uniref:SCO4225 family membrane protein n=1 Tax=Streptomyces sp. NPDC014995 TaxID=3364936 RepID=UPI0036FF2C40
MSNRRNGKRDLAGPIADNRISRGYPMLCAAVWVWVALDAVPVQHEDASFAAVWPWLITAPTSLPLALLPVGEGAAGLAPSIVSRWSRHW